MIPGISARKKERSFFLDLTSLEKQVNLLSKDSALAFVELMKTQNFTAEYNATADVKIEEVKSSNLTWILFVTVQIYLI